ncbi:hypothetical protein BOC40_31325 [Burkholderia pseudomallei]|nr:hypothetical protein BOC40_31325 [Burkholderia pseudomallei]ARL43785.1 hypothetical protein BOC50_11930 [Burkholderia pseudomallei]
MLPGGPCVGRAVAFRRHASVEADGMRVRGGRRHARHARRDHRGLSFDPHGVATRRATRRGEAAAPSSRQAARSPGRQVARSSGRRVVGSAGRRVDPSSSRCTAQPPRCPIKLLSR